MCITIMDINIAKNVMIVSSEKIRALMVNNDCHKRLTSYTKEQSLLLYFSR